MKKGAARPLDTAKRPGIDTNTPKCLENAKKPLVLKEYQSQALNTMLDDYAAGGTGMLQGECEIRNRLQPVPIFCVYRKFLDQ